MATTVTKTIKRTGGDYSSLSAAEAGEQRDLVAVDQVARFECYQMQDGGVAFGGWTTDATRRIEVVAAHRHRGVWTDRAYRAVASSYDGVIRDLGSTDFDLLLDGVQIWSTSAVGDWNINGYSRTAGSNGRISLILRDCIVRGPNVLNGTERGLFIRNHDVAGSVMRLENSIWYDWGDRPIPFGSETTAVWEILNCTADGGTSGIWYAYYFANMPAAWKIQNNRADKYTDAGGAPQYVTGTWSNNASEDASVIGTSAVPNATFNYVDRARKDFRLKTGDSGLDAGANLSALLDGDIVGTARPVGTAWDIGAFEGIDTALVAVDNFYGGTPGVDLATGNAAWTKHGSFAGTIVYTDDLHRRVRNETAVTEALYYHSGAPASADYEVIADFTPDMAGGYRESFVCGRINTAAATFYAAGWQDAGTESLRKLWIAKWVNGTRTILADVAYDAGTPDDRTTGFMLRMVGSSLKLFVDEGAGWVEKLSATDTSITAAGKAGIFFNRESSDSVGHNFGAFELRDYVASTFKFYATTLVAGASYSREDGGTFYSDILAGLNTGGDGLYVRSPLPPTGVAFKVGNITLDTSRVGVALNYEYGKDGAATINQTIQLRSADGTTLIREAVHNNVAARPLTASMDLSDLTLSGTYSVWLIDEEV